MTTQPQPTDSSTDDSPIKSSDQDDSLILSVDDSARIEGIWTESQTGGKNDIHDDIQANGKSPEPKRTRRFPVKALSGLGVFVVLSGGIVLASHYLGMGGMDHGSMDHGSMGHGEMSSDTMAGGQMDHGSMGHDMSGMSHDEMMRVDGAFNATPVTVEVVQPSLLQASVKYTGAIYPYSEVTVYPRVTGQLSNYTIYPGDRVQAGQTLASLDAVERVAQTAEARSVTLASQAVLDASQLELEEQRQQITQIQADLDYLKLQQDRFARLTAEGATSQDQYDLVTSQLDAKAAMLEGAEAKLVRLQSQVTSNQAQVNRSQAQETTATAFESYTSITAPISGVVQARMADPGVVVQPGMGIFKIGDYSQVRLQANVAQQDANRIEIGTPILATVPGSNYGVIRGEITSIFPQTDMTTRTVTVEAVVDNPGQTLLSGQFLDMEIMTARQENALSIPQSALTEFKGESAVWVVAGETAQRRQVVTGMTSRDRIEITNGLQPGDQIITSGHSRLMENSTVTVVDALDNPFVGEQQS